MNSFRISPCFLAFSFCFLVLSACDKKLDINNFDEEAWKGDKHACHGVRQNLAENLLASKNELKGLSQQEMSELLGKPERQELYARGQKFFIYHLSPAADCKELTPGQEYEVLYIRFSALNEANEIFVETLPN